MFKRMLLMLMRFFGRRTAAPESSDPTWDVPAPPAHWEAQPLPPAHWLDHVRKHAPELLDRLPPRHVEPRSVSETLNAQKQAASVNVTPRSTPKESSGLAVGKSIGSAGKSPVVSRIEEYESHRVVYVSRQANESPSVSTTNPRDYEAVDPQITDQRDYELRQTADQPTANRDQRYVRHGDQRDYLPVDPQIASSPEISAKDVSNQTPNGRKAPQIHLTGHRTPDQRTLDPAQTSPAARPSVSESHPFDPQTKNVEMRGANDYEPHDLRFSRGSLPATPEIEMSESAKPEAGQDRFVAGFFPQLRDDPAPIQRYEGIFREWAHRQRIDREQRGE